MSHSFQTALTQWNHCPNCCQVLSDFTWLVDHAGVFKKHQSLGHMEPSNMVRVFLLKFIITGYSRSVLWKKNWLEILFGICVWWCHGPLASVDFSAGMKEQLSDIWEEMCVPISKWSRLCFFYGDRGVHALLDIIEWTYNLIMVISLISCTVNILVRQRYLLFREILIYRVHTHI